MAESEILVAVGIQWRLGSLAVVRDREGLDSETVLYMPGNDM